MLLQDDVTGATTDVQWRMQTNATISLDSAGTTATLTLGGETLQAKLISGPSGATFSNLEPVRYATDPALPAPLYENSTAGWVDYGSENLNADRSNDGVSVLAVTVTGGGTFSLQVLFNPQYTNTTVLDSLVTPPNVTVTDWSLTSHNT